VLGGREIGEQLCRLALHERAILLNTLHWPDEIRDAGELALPAAEEEVHAKELAMAVMLIENLAARFDPERHRDQYREAVVSLVEAKLANQPPERAPAPVLAQVTDLMAALKASVEASRRPRADRDEEEPAPRVAAVGRRRRAS